MFEKCFTMNIKKIFCVVAFASLVCLGCSKEPDYNTGDEATDVSSSDEEASVAQIVKQHVHVSYTTYSDWYLYTLQFQSTLQQVFPNKNITYGVEAGYGSYDVQKTNISTSALFVIPWEIYDGTGSWGADNGNSKFHGLSIWGYTEYNSNFPSLGNLTSIGVTKSDFGTMYSMLKMFYNLKEKLYNGGSLTSAEQQQFNDSKKYAEEAGVKKIKNRLDVRAYVIIDGKKYSVGMIPH